MGANKKRFAFFVMLVCVALAAVSVFIAQDPPMRPIINRTSDNSSVSINHVIYNGEDVTERLDHDALIELLVATMSRRDGVFGGYLAADVLWEINLVHGGRPQHILLSRPDASQELNFWHESADGRIYRILDPAALADVLGQMLSEPT